MKLYRKLKRIMAYYDDQGFHVEKVYLDWVNEEDVTDEVIKKAEEEYENSWYSIKVEERYVLYMEKI